MSEGNFASIFSQVATAATEQCHATLVGKVISSQNKALLADKLNHRLDTFGDEVQRLIIGVDRGLFIKVNTKDRERLEVGAEANHPYTLLSKKWFNKKKRLGVPYLPNYFKFGKAVNKDGEPLVGLDAFLKGRLQHSASIFGKVEPKDIKIYQAGEELSLKRGRFSNTDNLIRQAGGVSANRIKNFSPHFRHYEVKVNLVKKVKFFTDRAVAEMIDPDNNESTGFARSKLSAKASIGRPNVGALLHWYYLVKLPAVIRKHYSYYGLIGG